MASEKIPYYLESLSTLIYKGDPTGCPLFPSFT